MKKELWEEESAVRSVALDSQIVVFLDVARFQSLTLCKTVCLGVVHEDGVAHKLAGNYVKSVRKVLDVWKTKGNANVLCFCFVLVVTAD